MEYSKLPFAVDETIEAAMALVPRIWQRDHTVWGDDPTEIADRLGWLDAPDRARRDEAALLEAADVVRRDGTTDVVLVGMGGSSLYPALLAQSAIHDRAEHTVRLHVLDSTDPAAVHRLETRLDWSTTALIASSKSGTTIETSCHLDRFCQVLADAVGPQAAQRVSVVTDPGSAFDERARRDGFAQVVAGQADVGGRFSALTPFGLLPAAVLGVTPSRHVASAEAVLEAGSSTDPARNHAAVLGAIMASAAQAGRDKLTLLVPDEAPGLGGWIEQLVAESTGKGGHGLIPVLGDEPGRAWMGDDRLVVAIGSPASYLEAVAADHVPCVRLPWSHDRPVLDQLAEQVATWELATVVAGALMGLNPFDQPDVAEAKAATQRVLDTGAQLPSPVAPDQMLADVDPGDYLAILGFVAPGSADELALHQAADRWRRLLRVPVTVGVGPRYLHSTGQLHKGGPANGHFLIVVGDDPVELEIPSRPFGFGALKRAQAAGDLATLRSRGRPVALTSLAHLEAQ